MRSVGIALILVLCLALPAIADIILLRNGGRIEGVITKESKDTVTVRLARGKIHIERSKIKKILRRSDNQNEGLTKEQEKKEQELERRAAELEKERKARARADKSRRERTPTPTVETVRSAKLAFQIQLPGGWTRSEEADTGILLRAKRNSAPFADLAIGTIPARTSNLARLQGWLLQQLEKNYQGFKVVKTELKQTGGRSQLIIQGQYLEGQQRVVLHSVFVETGQLDKIALYYRCSPKGFEALAAEISRSQDSVKILSP